MPPGEALDDAMRLELDEAIRAAESGSPVRFSVYLGPLPAGRVSAVRLHAQLDAPDQRTLIAVDLDNQVIEIVTGERASRLCADRACSLAALAMTSAFIQGDVIGGLRAGILVLGDHARAPEVLFTDQP